MRRILAILLLTAIFVALFPLPAVHADNVDRTYENMLKRAEAIVNYQWVAGCRIPTWNETPYKGRTYFEEGEVVIGMPYTLFSFELGMSSLLSLSQYANIAGDNFGTTFFCNSVGEIRTGPIYGSCCATFVSEVFGEGFMFGDTPAYGGVESLLNNYTITRRSAKANEILPGDALYDASKVHIVWVGKVTDQTITIYEQTPPVARKQTISRSSVSPDGYLVYNGRTYTYAARNDRLDHEGAHIPVTDPAVSSTCTVDGLTAGSHCAICGQNIETQKVLPAFGHSYEVTEKVDSTETQDGYIQSECSVCHEIKTDYLPFPNCASYTFTDVPFTAWYHNSVDFAFRNGYMNGTGPSAFDPDVTMSRAMLVTVLWRYEKEPESSPCSFSDVTKQTGDWYYDAVSWAAENGIVNGMGDNLFEPNGTITREQLAVILYRYSQSKGFDVDKNAPLDSFPDCSQVGIWSVDAMQWAVGQGLISGTSRSDGRVCLDPQGRATRAQVATILMRYIQNIVEP